LDVSRSQVNITPDTRYTRAVNGGFGVEGDRIGDNIDAASRPRSKLWTLTAAPSRTLNRPVAMLKLPAAPDAGCSPNKFWAGKSPEPVTMALESRLW
jgi:hypothetical protein